MRILALDTTAERLGMCLFESDRKVRSLHIKGGVKQDLMLDAALRRLFPASGPGIGSLDAVAVCTGPGRFTSIRVGVSFAVMLSRSLGTRILGLRGLETLAYQALWEKAGDGVPKPFTVCAIRPVVRDEVFWGFYRVSVTEKIESISPDRWGKLEDLKREMSDIRGPVVLAGEAAASVLPLLGSGVSLRAPRLRAETLARRAAQIIEQGGPLPPPEPYYLKPANYERK